MTMVTRETIDNIPDVIADRLAEANEYMLRKMGENIKRIGMLAPSDVHRLDEMRRAGADIKKIVSEVSKRTERSLLDIATMFAILADINMSEAYDAYKFRGLEYVPYAKNDYLKRFVESYIRRTAGTLRNLSQTHALRIFSAKKNAFVSFADGYKDAIDQAVTNSALGIQDYQSAMRDTLRKVGESGLCTMEYESGYTRRLDSAVRMNLLEGIRQINQGIQDQIGEELGADGVEISAHVYCAPDHEDIQGRQMTNAEYAKWDAEHAYPKRQIGKLNCHHFVFRVLLGIQEPIHTPEELDRMKEENAKGIYFEGKHYTGYQATQIQRSLEAQIRKYKDLHTLARSAGDDVLKRKAQTQITALTHKYKEFSEAAGLSFKGKRLQVSGYKPSGAGLTSAAKNSIIIPKSVGAAGKNYPVRLPDGNYAKFSEGTSITKIVTIAGKGTKVEIRNRFWLESTYKKAADQWEKKRGEGVILEKGKRRTAEVHWYEADNIRVEMKVKRYFDES